MKAKEPLRVYRTGAILNGPSQTSPAVNVLFVIVYQMGRLCGGAHEISGIKAPLFLHGWVGGGGVGWSMAVYSDRWWVGVVLSGLTWGGD